MSDVYEAAWAATRTQIIEDGMSWSGHEHNAAFLNVGDGRFADVSRLSRADSEGDGRAVLVVDWDDDGRQDLILKNRTGPRVQVFHNRYPAPGRFLSVELRGNGTTSNRDAIGARVVVELDGRTLTRTLRAGEGFLSQSSKRLHFGLGGAEVVERVTVHWPDGTSSVRETVPVDTRLVVVQGDEANREPSRPAPQALGELAHSEPTALEGKATRVVLAYALPMAEVRIPSFDDPARTVADLAGKPVLLTVWGKDCTVCMREFIELRAERERVARMDVTLVTLNRDLDLSHEAARSLLAKYDQDTPTAGYVDDELARFLWGVVNLDLFGPRNNLAIASPTSFLLDPEGCLVAVYMGQTSLSQLEEDVAAIRAEDPRPLLDRLGKGRRLVHQKRDFESIAQSCEANGLDALAAYYRRVDAAYETYLGAAEAE